MYLYNNPASMPNTSVSISSANNVFLYIIICGKFFWEDHMLEVVAPSSSVYVIECF